MKLCTFEHDGRPRAAIILGAALLPIAEINARVGTAIPEELLALIEADCLDELREASAGIDATIPLSEVRLWLPYAPASLLAWQELPPSANRLALPGAGYCCSVEPRSGAGS